MGRRWGCTFINSLGSPTCCQCCSKCGDIWLFCSKELTANNATKKQGAFAGEKSAGILQMRRVSGNDTHVGSNDPKHTVVMAVVMTPNPNLGWICRTIFHIYLHKSCKFLECCTRWHHLTKHQGFTKLPATEITHGFALFLLCCTSLAYSSHLLLDSAKYAPGPNMQPVAFPDILRSKPCCPGKCWKAKVIYIYIYLLRNLC